MRREKEVYYWKNGGEVDFVVKEKDNSLTAINVTYSDSIAEREVSALKNDSEKTENRITYIPLWKWMLKM